jgi:hypothetical protein
MKRQWEGTSNLFALNKIKIKKNRFLFFIFFKKINLLRSQSVVTSK